MAGLLKENPLGDTIFGQKAIPENEVIQKADVQYDSVGYFTNQMINVFTDLRIPWKFDPDASLKYDPEAYERLRRYPVIQSNSEEAIAKLSGTAWHFNAETDQGIRTIPYLTSILRRVEGFGQARSWLARSYLDGRSWLQKKWKLLHISIDDDIVRPWWIPTALIPVHKSQFLLRNEAVQDAKYGTNIKYFWNRMNPVNMRQFIVNMDDYVTSVKDASHLNWSYGWGKYDACYPVWTMAINVWRQLCDAIESSLYPAMAFNYDPKVGFGANFSGDGDISSESPSNAAYVSAVREGIKSLRNWGFIGLPSTDKVTMIDRDGGGMSKVMELLRYFEQKMTEIIGISITPGGGMESTGAPGSLASSQVGAQMRSETLDTLQSSLVEEPIQSQLISQIWKYNFKNFQALGMRWNDAAVFKLGSPQQADTQKKAQGFQMALQLGVPISKKDFRAFFDLETPIDEEDTLSGGQQPMQSPQLNNTPGSQPGIFSNVRNMPALSNIANFKMDELTFAESALSKQDVNAILDKHSKNNSKKKSLTEIWTMEYQKNVRTYITGDDEEKEQAGRNIKLLLNNLMLLFGLLGADSLSREITQQMKFDESDISKLETTEPNKSILKFQEESVEDFEARLTKQQNEFYAQTMEMFGVGPDLYQDIDLSNPQWFVQFEEAIKSLVDAQPVLTSSAQELGEMYQRENVIGAVEAQTFETLETMREEVLSYIKGEVSKEDASEKIAQVEGWSQHYALTCLRTNAMTAHSHGRVTQYKKSGDLVVGWKLSTMRDGDVRPMHRIVDGLVASTEWFKEHPGYFPCLGYNCRCQGNIVTKYEAEKQNWLDENGELIPQLPVNWQNGGAEDKTRFGVYPG